MTDKCMKYYYPDSEDIEKMNLSCEPRIFDNINNLEFTNKDLLDFIEEEYSSPFNELEEKPFEFNENYINDTYEQLCSTSSYSLKPQQKFIGQLINPNSNINNMLIFHGLGSGKTCTSLLIGEAFSNVENKDTIYVVPAALEKQYIKEIVGEIRYKSIQSCTSMCLVYDNLENKYLRSIYIPGLNKGNINDINSLNILDKNKKKLDTLLKDKKKASILLINTTDTEKADQLTGEITKLNNSIKKLEYEIKIKEDQIMSKVNKVFTITTHQKFIDKLMKITDTNQIILKDFLQSGSSLFRDSTTLIIDEIQNLVSASGSRYKILYNSIKYYINPKVRKVLLSATPIYDNPFELALTMNLLNPRVPFPTKSDDFYKFFVGKTIKTDSGVKLCIERNDNDKIDYSTSCLINVELFKYLCSGYVSYFKGGNPIAYPYKRTIELYHPLELDHKAHYISSLRKDVVKDLYRVIKKLSSSSTSRPDEIKGILIDEYSEQEASGTLTNARQAINAYYPGNVLFDGDDELDISQAEKTRLTILENKESLKREFKDKTPEQILLELGRVSSKIKSILDISTSVEGTIFIYSNWLGYGVESISTILDLLGYSRFPNKGDNYKSYFVWSPSVESDKDIIEKARETFNSTDNSDGKLIKFMLGTSSIKEGVSFKNLAQIHLLDPWWNNSRIDQIIARGFRLCSHVDLPANRRHTDVFKHVGVLPGYFEDGEDDNDIEDMFKDIKEEFERRIFSKSNLPKDIDPIIRVTINKVAGENIIRKAINIVFKSLEWTKYMSIDEKIVSRANEKSLINSKFERELKSVGVDCELFKNGNLIRLEENIRQISPKEYQLYYKNPSNLYNYLRDGIPETISFLDITSRKYSYPNTENTPITFTRAKFIDNMFEKITDGEILNESVLTKDLVMNEDIQCWKTPMSFIDVPTTSVDIKNYFTDKALKRELNNNLRINFLGQLDDKIKGGLKFSDNDRLKRLRILKCLKRILNDKTLDKSLRIKIQQYTKIFQGYEDIDRKIMLIADTYSYNTPEINRLYKLAVSNPGIIESEYAKISNK